MSQTTTRAPSSAKSSAPSRPMPIPAPVISTTLSLSRPGIARSDPLEVADQLPVRDGLIEGLLLEPAVVQVVLDHLLAKRLPRDARALQLRQPFAERLRHLREGGVLIGVAFVEGRWLELLLDTVEPGRDGGGEGEVRVRVSPGNPILDPEARPLAADPEPARAVVPAARDACRREAPRLVALVGVDGGCVEVGQLARHGHLAGDPLLEERGALARAARREEVLLAGPIPD